MTFLGGTGLLMVVLLPTGADPGGSSDMKVMLVAALLLVLGIVLIKIGSRISPPNTLPG